jgi:PAS domain S-box-containing protein
MADKPTYEELLEAYQQLSLHSQKLSKAEQSIHYHNEQLQALHETALGLLETLDCQELLQNILERAAGLAKAEHGYIYLLDPSGGHMEIMVGMGFFSGQIGRRVKPGEGLGGKVWQTGHPLLVQDYRHWAERIKDPALDSLHSILGIPLKFDQRVRGVIGLGHVDPVSLFDDEDLQIIERFAAFALLALEKAELYSEILRELNERRKAEVRIRKSEQQYRNYLESSPDPIVVYDMKGLATYVNPAFERTFGMSRDELLGKQIDFVPSEAWPETRAAIQAMLNGETIQLFETQRLTRDGIKLDVQLSSCLYMDENGDPIGNIVTMRDITAHKQAEKALRNYQDQLEELVQERTAELGSANRRLALEVEERKRAETALRRREEDLQAQSQHLEEVNTALRVLLKQRETDKNDLQQNLLYNVKELVAPYLSQLNKTALNTRQQTLIRILESNLDNIVSPFITRLSSRYVKFTPMEIRVANLIKEGKTNKEIGELLSISKNTVLFHRHHIRRKLKITKTSQNLRSKLLSFDE